MVREALGVYGRMLLDFWLEHNLIISSIVLLYGIVVLIAQNNFQNLVSETYKLLGKEKTTDRLELKKILAAQTSEFWNILQNSSKFPFITLPFSLFIYRVTKANMNKLFGRYLSYQQKTKTGKTTRRLLKK
jgi:ABC-type maltose transport system permease subunit